MKVVFESYCKWQANQISFFAIRSCSFNGKTTPNAASFFCEKLDLVFNKLYSTIINKIASNYLSFLSLC